MTGVKLAAIDPGITTGLAAKVLGDSASLRVEEYRAWRGGYSREEEVIEAIAKCVMKCDLVVIEDFVLRLPIKSLNRDGLAPVRITAGVEQALYMMGFAGELWRQSASNAMTTFTDDRLRSLGAWTRGKPHGRDATRHLLLAERKLEQRTLKTRR